MPVESIVLLYLPVYNSIIAFSTALSDLDVGCHTIKFHTDDKPWVYICSKGFFGGLIFGKASVWRGLLSKGILRFKMGLACQ